MTGLPHYVSTRAFDAAQGGGSYARLSDDPQPYAASAEDVAALAAVRAASAVFLDALKRHPWTYDATETVSWADHVAEHAAIDRALDAALAEARASMEAVS